jgi:transcriptional regulator with XRE-family HTH domain
VAFTLLSKFDILNAVPMKFAEWLRGQVDSRPEWSQKAFAALIGVSPSTVSNWLGGNYVPEPPQLLKIAKETGTEPVYLFNICYGMPLPEGTPEGRRRVSDALDHVFDSMTPEERQIAAEMIELIRRNRL